MAALTQAFVPPMALLLTFMAVATVSTVDGQPTPPMPQTMPQAIGTISPRIERWRPFIAEASRRFGIPQAWIAAVMQAESGGSTHLKRRPIVSPAGAMGLMQVMPGTWAAMRRQHGLGPAPHDPRDNILAGSAYLRAMYDRFGYPGLFAAYNAGPARYAEHLRTGRPLPRETRSYIAQIAQLPVPSSAPPARVAPEGLFFPLGTGRDRSFNSAASGPESFAQSRLFVPLNNAADHAQ